MRSRLTLVVGAVAVIAAACSGDDEAPPETATGTATEAPATGTMVATETATAEPTVEVVELEGFTPQTLVHANTEFTVTGVRTANQTMRSYAEGGEPEIAEETFTFLDVTARNLMTRTAGEFQESDYTLIVGGTEIDADQSMSFLSDLTGILQPDATVESFLAFPIEAGVALEDAALQFGAAPDRPSLLPLLASVPESMYPITLAGEDAAAEGVGPTNGGTIVFTLLEVTYAIDRPLEESNSPTGNRADEREVFLTIHLRAEKTSGRGNDILEGGLRLRVDDAPISPWDVATDATGSTQTPFVEPGASTEAWVGFMVPTDSASLVLQVGDFEEEPGEIEIPLPEELP